MYFSSSANIIWFITDQVVNYWIKNSLKVAYWVLLKSAKTLLTNGLNASMASLLLCLTFVFLQWLQTAASCKAKGAPSCDIHDVELSKSDEVRKFARDVLDKYKNVDIRVNNVGMGPSPGSGPIKGGSLVEHDRFAWSQD